MKYFFFYGFLIWSCSLFSQAGKIDSLENRLRSSMLIPEKISLMNELSRQYAPLDFNKSMSYARRAEEFSKRTGNKIQEANSANSVGNAFYFSNQLDSAITYLNISLGIYSALRDSSKMADVLSEIGQAYYYQGDYKNATGHYLRALAISESIHTNLQTAVALNYLGQIYFAQKQTDKALSYYNKSLTLRKSEGDRFGEGQTLNSIGNVYYSIQQYQEAIDYFLRALSIMEELGKTHTIATITGNVGAVYGELKQYEMAVKYFSKALIAQKANGDSAGISNTLSNIGMIYLHKNDPASAQKYLEQSLRIATGTKNKSLIATIYRDLAITCAEKKDYENGYLYYQKYAELRDTLLTENSNKQIAEMAEKYSSEKRELQIKNLEKDSEKQVAVSLAESRRKNAVITSVVSVLLLVIVFSGLLFSRLRTIRKQKAIIEQQKHVVEEKNKDITDSINYAQRIQRTLLASDKLMRKNLPDHFVLYQPKEIVSGDFFWATEKDDRFYLAVCDSTGHGVPGAFMSILNISFLNEAINEKGIVEPCKIFDHARKKLVENISQEGAMDGMDGILLCFDYGRNEISYAAAYNAPIIVGEKIEELHADKMPIGLSDRTAPFTNHLIRNKKNDVLYLYSDGYADQFGGPKGKKFKYKQLNELILSISEKSMEEQKEVLLSRLQQWKGNLEQVDDILIVGIRLGE